MSGPIGAVIDDSMIPLVISENRLPIGITRAEIIRYCLARVSGMDHYDALREAERPRNIAGKASIRDNGLTKVSADVPEQLLELAMKALDRTNVSEVVRYAIASNTGKHDSTEAQKHAIAPAGKTRGRPRKKADVAA